MPDIRASLGAFFIECSGGAYRFKAPIGPGAAKVRSWREHQPLPGKRTYTRLITMLSSDRGPRASKARVPTVPSDRVFAMHPNEALLRREYEARAARDDRALTKILADDVVWHVPGKSAIAGEYRGVDRVMEYVRRRRELVDGAFEITVLDVFANDEHGFVMATGRATRGGQTFEWRAHGLYRFRDGRIAECWVLPESQYEFDRIWS